ncbi:MAG: DUF1343 domain-containing protein [Deltaproteobacteria bacterium]|nr:DUF1343 domain-containing protein [Deltaproteobacteria bacterium]RLB82791.1 MAG: DUF1343 domain-containing protein [Deltaproteobacteria bacterium]
MKPIQTGIERLLATSPQILQGKRLGLLANPASVACPKRDQRFEHTRVLIADHYPGQLKVIFSPQHGFFAEKQDNMIPSEDLIDPVLGIPIFSLYGQTRMPTKAMLEPIDILIVDLQDVGTRVYTYVYTMALCLQAARIHGKQVLVLDRPNPIGGNRIEGNCLKPEYASFVGMYPIPMRHGLTIGELALLFNDHFGIDCELTVISMSGWKREMFFQDTGLPWIAPSPNLPTPTSAFVYPGQVLWEGTNVSEGRGTTQPFEIFGAPFFDLNRLETWLQNHKLSGVHLRPLAFEPTSNKWEKRLCHGFQIHVLEPMSYRPYRTTLTLLQAVVSVHPEAFQWKLPPYEYEFEKLPFDVITGDPAVRKAVEGLEPLEDLEQTWAEELKCFEEIRRPYLLYE